MTERDDLILEALAKTRFLTTSQLARLAFDGSRPAANKRLRKLLDAGLVRVWVRNLASDNVYALTRKGVEALAEPDLTALDAKAVRDLDGNLDHLLSINDARISLALALPDAGAKIAWWRSDWELRASFREPVVPDALFSLDGAGLANRVFALELDNHTKAPRAFAQKILAYRSSLSRPRGLYGLLDLAILVAGRDERWLEKYWVLVGQVAIDLPIWFASLADIRIRGPMERIWRGPRSDAFLSLRTLLSLPYRTEGDAQETGTESRS